MDAGAVHCITENAQFTVYKDNKLCDELGTLLVASTKAYVSYMRIPLGASQINLPEGAVAMQTKAGDKPDILLYVPMDDLFVPVFGAVSHLLECNGAEHRNISFAEKNLARLGVAFEGNHFVLDIQDPRATNHGIKRIPYHIGISLNDVYPVLSAAAHYYRHLDCTTYIRQLFDQVVIEFFRLEDSDELDDDDDDFQFLRQPYGGNLIHKVEHDADIGDIYGCIELVADLDEIYGVRITNNTAVPLYVSVFFFDSGDFSISKCSCIPARLPSM
jgi:hypothetical protein